MYISSKNVLGNLLLLHIDVVPSVLRNSPQFVHAQFKRVDKILRQVQHAVAERQKHVWNHGMCLCETVSV